MFYLVWFFSLDSLCAAGSREQRWSSSESGQAKSPGPVQASARAERAPLPQPPQNYISQAAPRRGALRLAGRGPAQRGGAAGAAGGGGTWRWVPG